MKEVRGMKAIELVLIMRECHPALLFKEAADYYENRMPKEILGVIFYSHCTEDEEKRVFLTSIPEFVENYCIDVLSGRVIPPAKPKPKQIGEGNEDKEGKG